MENIVKNKEAYEPNEGNYYLGYRDADLRKEHAKYWNPLVAAVSDEVQKGLSASPWASALGIH